MKYCKTCSKKGFFLNLHNEMCMDCHQELVSLESKYESLLKKITRNTFDQFDIITSLNLLSIKLRKFSKINNAVSSEDCTNLIKGLTQSSVNTNDIDTTQLKSNVKHFTSIMQPSHAPIDEVSTPEIIDTPSAILQYEYSASTIKADSPMTNAELSEVIEPQIIAEPKKISESKKISSPSNIVQPLVQPSDNKNAIKSKIPNKISDSKKQIDVVKNTTQNIATDNKEFFVERDALRSLVRQNLYNDAKSVVHKLTSSPLTPENLAYYTFLLKDTYVKPLSELNITEIDNQSISQLITNNLNTLSMLVNQPHNALYDFFNYVAFSIQTTGLNSEKSNILEISAVKVRYGKIEFKFHTFIDTNSSIGASLSRKTGIYNKDIKGSPDLATAMQNFLKFTEGTKLITHDASYNIGFLDYHSKRLSGSALLNKYESTLTLYKNILKKYGTPPPLSFDLTTCCKGILSPNDLKEISLVDSKSEAGVISIFKLYETLKYK